MDDGLAVKGSSKISFTSLPEIQCQRTHVIAAIVGSLIIAAGIILKFYPGVNNVVMGTMIAVGSLIVIVDFFLARKWEEEPPLRAEKPSFEPVLDNVTLPPPVSEVVKNIGAQFATPYELLSIAIDSGDADEVNKIINDYYKKTPDLFKVKFDNKTPLQRALHNFNADGSFDSYLIVSVIYSFEPEDIINGLSPFAFICKGIISKCAGVMIETSPEQRRLLVKLRPKEDALLKKEIDSLKDKFKASQLKLVEEQLFVFVKNLKG